MGPGVGLEILEKRKTLLLLGIESRVPSHPFYSLTAIPTEIFRLHIDVIWDIKLINTQIFKM
jgi:hypothetical protein